MSARAPDPAWLLELVASGRDAYAEGLNGTGNPVLDEAYATLRGEAAAFRMAARIVGGDYSALPGLLPSWLWTDEVRALWEDK